MNTVPFIKIGIAAVSMAADNAIEQKGGLVPPDTVTLARVGYLRRVPDYVVPLLEQAWPHTRVKWTTVKTSVCRTSAPKVFASDKVCFPLVYLESLIAFLRPSGKDHLAKIDIGLPLDPDAVFDLDAMPRKGEDPDF